MRSLMADVLAVWRAFCQRRKPSSAAYHGMVRSIATALGGLGDGARRAGAALVMLALAACGGGNGQGPRQGPATVDGVLVVITPTPDTLPFDPRGARLRAATAELSRVAGHPVTFVIDAALAAETRSGFEGQLIEGVETTA